MVSCNYNYQNPFLFVCFPMLIRAIILRSPLGLQNLNLNLESITILHIFVD